VWLVDSMSEVLSAPLAASSFLPMIRKRVVLSGRTARFPGSRPELAVLEQDLSCGQSAQTGNQTRSKLLEKTNHVLFDLG